LASASTVNPKLVDIALQNCEPTAFERYAQTVFGAVMGPNFKPLGGHKDEGADGFIDGDLYVEVGKPTRFFQASKEITVESKIKRTITRLQEVGREVKSLYYASSHSIALLDKLEFALSEDSGISVRIYDRNFFVQHSNHNGDAVAAFHQYLRPALAFLDEILTPSYPNKPPFDNARAVCAFLGQEIERRLGTTQALEAVCDALVLWALEDTDPATKKLMTEDEIVNKVESVIPTAKRFFRGQVAARLIALTTKTRGTRSVNIYNKDSRYCLPYESREALKEHTIEDEKLKVDVTASFLSRLVAKTDDKFDTPMLEKIGGLLHQTLETVFERQGFDAARHFLEEDLASNELLDPRPIIDIAEEVLKTSGIKSNLQPEILLLMKQVLREVFYASRVVERTYCARLARTYILLFTIRNTPEIIEYFNSMSKNFVLYVGSDLVIRAISEHFVDADDQMTVNAFRIIKQAGSNLVLSEIALEEVHSHIWASHLEYKNVYGEIDAIVDRDLASQCDHILIRAYYYAKLEESGHRRPRTWTSYLSNFMTAEKITGPTSQASMQSLRDTLCNMFGFEYEPREVTEADIDTDELHELTAKIQELRRQKPKGEILAKNDAFHILRIHKVRHDREGTVGNPYGYKTWWLTQDTISGRAAAIVTPKRREIRYVMRPEFLINYIAYNPTSNEVRESLKTIFPSLLGVRLGSRLEKNTLNRVLVKVREVHSVDPARALAMIAEHSNALKSSRMRSFVLKYDSAV
jgi:hypothetical protein